MRIAIHHPDGAVSAYKFGRIEDGVHNDHPIFGNMPIKEFVDAATRQAQDEYPDCEIVIERMILKPDNPEESIWVPDHEFNREVHRPTPSGNQVDTPALATAVSQEAR